MLEKYEVETLNEDTDQLEPTLREMYHYNMRGFYESRIQQLWNDNAMEWENALRDQLSYSPIGVWTSWNRQVWVEDAWSNSISREFKFMDGRQLDLEQVWEPANSEWINSRRRYVEYDTYGNLVRERSFELWDPVSEDWINGVNTKQCQHYWSESNTTSVDPILEDLTGCLMMNPYLIGSEIQCMSLVDGKQYEARLIDQTGKMIHRQLFFGNDGFSLEGDITEGMYFLFINQQDAITYKRKLFIKP